MEVGLAMARPIIAVYGATGHTGRLVAAELVARGHQVALAGRDAAALSAAADALPARPGQVTTHHAPLDDGPALRGLAETARVLIHCAGPFSVTGDPVAAAALAAGCHYVDHAVEPHHVKHLFDTYQIRARETGIVMAPGFSFYGGLGDLLSSAVTAVDPAGAPAGGFERVTVAYAVRGWRLTAGAKATAAQLFAETERITYHDGALHIGYVEPRNVVFPFPPPVGPRTMLAPFPCCDAVTIPRHVPTRTVELLLTADTFTEPGTFDADDLDPATRAATDFTVAVQALADPDGHHSVAGHLTGHDLWRAAALASVEAALHLADCTVRGRGVLSPSEVLDAGPLLRDLEKQGAFTLTLPLPTGTR
jgi:saccharopine dehydrogenase-like protein